MRLRSIELRRVRLPLVTPFRTSFGTAHERETIVARLDSGEAIGWAECAAEPEPLYSAEFLDGCQLVLRDHLLPRLAALGDELTAAAVAPALAAVKGQPMAKALLETAVLDAELTASGTSFGRYLGAVAARVPSGVSVGIMDSIEQLLDAVAGYLAAGYLRIKLKIEPGWDLEPVRAVRERFGEIPLQVDANTAYGRADFAQLAKLDEFGLLLIEQPLAETDLLGHAALAKVISTPVCLDESIESAQDAVAAITLGACSVINVKPARVGGYLEARRIHDVALAHGVTVWCGGMLETGIGRGPNLALAALPGFTLVGGISASARYYQRDLTPPFVIEGGHIAVPAGPGIGVSVLEDVLEELTIDSTTLTY